MSRDRALEKVQVKGNRAQSRVLAGERRLENQEICQRDT